jgi:hypothetical protein
MTAESVAVIVRREALKKRPERLLPQKRHAAYQKTELKP